MAIFWIDLFLLFAGTGVLFFFAFTSWREGEKRALWVASLLLPANILFWSLPLIFRQQADLKAANSVSLVLLAVLAVL